MGSQSSNRYQYTSYGINCVISAGRADANGKYCQISLPAVFQPSDAFLISDKISWGSYVVQNSYNPAFRHGGVDMDGNGNMRIGTSNDTSPVALSTGKTNILYVDGHVEPKSPRELICIPNSQVKSADFPPPLCIYSIYNCLLTGFDYNSRCSPFN